MLRGSTHLSISVSVDSLLCDNKFKGGTPSWIEKLDKFSDLKPNSDLSCETDVEIGCTNRKVGHW